MKQIIIAIGREKGSGGREIANKIANELGVAFYDVRILKEVAQEMNLDLDPGELQKFDEAPRNFFTSRKRGEYTNSVEEILAHRQFEFLKNKAEAGESFVVLGRCADYVLRKKSGLIKIFVTAEHSKKTDRIASRYDVTLEEAEKIIKKTDKGRKQYYERYTDGIKWGDAFWHDLVVKSSTLGIERTAEVLLSYIDVFRNTEFE